MNQILERYLKLPLGNICDANGKIGAMDCGIRPVDMSCHLAGYAYTCKGHPGDNLALHKAMLTAPVDSVIVADFGGYTKGGHFGEIMATGCMVRGIRGLVIDGTIRDARDIAKLGFPVFSKGSCPNGTVKETVGQLEIPVVVGGVAVKTGDLIVGDIDGVVVIKKEKILEVLEAAEAIAHKEDEIAARLRKGETTVDIYQFPRLIDKRSEQGEQS